MNNRYIATAIVIILAALMTFLKPGGKGALILWPLFGSLNQLLAALGLAVVSVYMFKRNMNYLLAATPMLFVLGMTIWSMLNNLFEFIRNKDILLLVISTLILVLAIWLLAEGVFSLVRKRSLKGDIEKRKMP